MSIRELKKRIGLLKSGAGFTLIEIIVVFSIISVVSSIGIASFVTYSKTQAFNSVVSDFTNTLSLAKSRAQSQVKPSSCSGTFDGYQMALCKLSPSDCLPADADKDFALSVVCDGILVSPAYGKILPNGINIDRLSPSLSYSLLFHALSGGVNQEGQVKIEGNGYCKVVNISTTSAVTVSSCP